MLTFCHLSRMRKEAFVTSHKAILANEHELTIFNFNCPSVYGHFLSKIGEISDGFYDFIFKLPAEISRFPKYWYKSIHRK